MRSAVPKGPKKLPAAILELRGSWRAKGRKAEEVQYDGIPEPPEVLEGRAKEVWGEVLPELIRLNVAATVDAPALCCYCVAVAQFEEACRILKNTGMTMIGYNGKVEKHPMVSVRFESMDRIVRFAEQFGFTPASRTNVKRGTGDGDSDKGQEGPQASDFVHLHSERAAGA